jgi:hypothetical protein
VFRESDGIRTILRLTEALGQSASAVNAAAIAYVQSVLSKEWPAMRQGTDITEDLGALRNLSLAVLAPTLTATTPPAAHQAMLEGLVQIRQARLERLILTAGTSDSINWLAMLILGMLTQIAVAVVQLDKLRPQALALFVFTTAFIAAVVMIGLAERPFARGLISDSPLRAAIASTAR